MRSEQFGALMLLGISALWLFKDPSSPNASTFIAAGLILSFMSGRKDNK